MATRDQRPSEFGGRPGQVQRLNDGHTPTVSERQAMLRVNDPSPKRFDTGEFEEAAETGERIA